MSSLLTIVIFGIVGYMIGDILAPITQSFLERRLGIFRKSIDSCEMPYEDGDAGHIWVNIVVGETINAGKWFYMDHDISKDTLVKDISVGKLTKTVYINVGKGK